MIVVTGAAGAVGGAVRAGLADRPLRLLDLRAADDPRPNEDVRVVDLRDLDATVAAFAGTDAVVHLAAQPDEAPFAEILDANVVPTYHVYEAARRAGVRRVVFASTVHVTGFYPWGRTVEPDEPPRPDTYYGVSKVFGEALGRLYADKHGLEVVCVRIVGYAPEPTDPMYLWGWLSPRDAGALFRACVTAPGVPFRVLYGVSANTRGFWSRSGWAEVGYAPVDDAERYADRFGEVSAPWTYQGMEFTDPGYGGLR